jgi:type I restriction enzyme S subunit
VLPESKKEQQKIAEILGTIDEDITKTQELIEATEKLKRGLMQGLFTPKNSWIDKNLSDVSNIIMGQSPSSTHYNEVDNGLPLIQGNADIKDRKSIKRFSTSEITKEVKKGDIIMGVRAPVGCIATASFDSCIGRGVCGIQPQSIDKNYLYHYLVSKESEFEKKAQGSTFTAINSNEVRKISIIFPNDMEEQKEIADILSSIDEKIVVNKKLKEKLILLKKGLMQDLLSGRVRVNI